MWEPIREQLTRNLSGNTRSQSVQLAEPLCTDPGSKSGKSARANFHLKKKKMRWRRMYDRIFCQILASEEKATSMNSIMHYVIFLSQSFVTQRVVFYTNPLNCKFQNNRKFHCLSPTTPHLTPKKRKFNFRRFLSFQFFVTDNVKFR